MTVDALIDDFATHEDNWLANVRKTLLGRWWLVLALTLAGLIAAVIYLRGATYLYSAELKVYAAPSTTGQAAPGGSSLGGLASLAGIGVSGGDSATPFRLYLEGVNAREVAVQLAKRRDLMRGVFGGEWDPATGGWRERRGFLGSLKRSVWDVLGLRSRAWHAPDAARLQGFIADQVTVAQSPKSPLVAIRLDHPDPQFAVRFLTALGGAVDDYLRARQQERVRRNITYLSDKLRGVTFVEQRQVLFNALAEQERQAMLANSLAPYAANPFGVATASLEPTTPRQVPLLLAGLIGGFVIGCAIALLLGRPQPRATAMIESA